MKKLIITLCICTFSISLFSQEKLVSFFDNQDIISISKDFARQNNWFANYPTFREAKFFELIDGNYVLEVFYVKQDSTYKDRTIMSRERKKFYTDSLFASIPATAQIPKFTQKGRVPLLVGSSLVSLTFYGSSAAIITSKYTTSIKWPFAAFMFTTASGIIVPYYLTKNKEVSLAQAGIVFHGQSRGLFHGIAISTAINNQMDETYVNSISMATSIIEGIGGYQMTKKLHLSSGQISTYQMGIDAGIIGGIAIADIAKFTDFTDSEQYNSNQSKFWGTIVGTSLVCGAAGLVAGRQFNYSTGEAVALRASGILGAFLTVPVIHEFENDKTKPFSTGVVIGGLAGFVAGHYLFNESELTITEGMYISLGEVTGGLLGLGTAYLIAPENSYSSKITSYLLWGGAIGTLSGYGLMSYLMLNNTPKKTAFDQFHFQINPMGFYNSRLQKTTLYQYNSIPIVMCSMNL